MQDLTPATADILYITNYFSIETGLYTDSEGIHIPDGMSLWCGPDPRHWPCTPVPAFFLDRLKSCLAANMRCVYNTQ